MSETRQDPEVWTYDAANSDRELDNYLSGIESYSKLSDDSLNIILRSFNETVQQKKIVFESSAKDRLRGQESSCFRTTGEFANIKSRCEMCLRRIKGQKVDEMRARERICSPSLD